MPEPLKTTDGAYTVELGGMQTINAQAPDDPSVDSVRVRIISTYNPEANSGLELNLDFDYETMELLIGRAREILVLES